MNFSYFKENKESQHLFNKFNNKSLDQLRVDDELDVHAGKVMSLFDTCIQHIEDFDETLVELEKATVVHRHLKTFASSMYFVSRKVLSVALKFIVNSCLCLFQMFFHFLFLTANAEYYNRNQLYNFLQMIFQHVIYMT